MGLVCWGSLIVLLINLYFSIAGCGLGCFWSRSAVSVKIQNWESYSLTVETKCSPKCFLRMWPLEGPHTKQCLNLVSTFTTQIKRNSQLTQRWVVFIHLPLKLLTLERMPNLRRSHNWPTQTAYMLCTSKGKTVTQGGGPSGIGLLKLPFSDYTCMFVSSLF